MSNKITRHVWWTAMALMLGALAVGTVRAILNDSDCAAKGGMWVRSPGIAPSDASEKCVALSQDKP